MSDYRIIQGDVLAKLAELPAESVHCVVTSPPYWGLRDYGTGQWTEGRFACDHVRTVVRTGAGMEALGEQYRGGGKKAAVLKEIQYSVLCEMCGATRIDQQIGLEKTPAEFIAKMVEVFAEVRRVLRSDGTCWVNMGDSYNANGRIGHGTREGYKQNTNRASAAGADESRTTFPGLKPKDLCGMPWRLAFALQDDGWWLRQDIIWSKPNPMPESVTDRCTKAHEYLFLLTKSARYFYDAEAIKEDVAGDPEASRNRWDTKDYLIPGQKPQKRLGRAAGNNSHKLVTEYEASESEEHRTAAGLMKIADTAYATRNKRSVWEIATEPYAEAHFATFPTKLVEPCIRAGCPPGGTVLDPFNGSGTTGLVALTERCHYIGIELNPKYVDMAERRLSAATAQGVLL